MSIYSPSVQREAQLLGITDLQAYRMAQTREILLRREGEKRRVTITTLSVLQNPINWPND